MNQKTLVIAGAGVLLLLLLSNSASAEGTMIDFDNLASKYGSAKAQRLMNLYAALQNKGLTDQQILLMLSQALFETGLFTGNPNYNNMDNLNNFAGITGNSRYAAGSGSIYAAYPNLDAFVNDWLKVLSYNNRPIDATSPYDFVARLKQNGYFTDSITVYQTGVAQYYNLLTQNITTTA